MSTVPAVMWLTHTAAIVHQGMVVLTVKVLQLFLLPANEVWDKVMFLHLCVSHSVHRGAPTGTQADTPPPPTESGGTHSSNWTKITSF